MAGKLRSELKQRKPFESLEQEAYLNLQRTADALARRLADLFRESGLSPNQYNVLRILRGSRDEGLACGEIGDRMITRDPDITRLLDRLEHRGQVRRARGREDRRVVKVFITAAGLRMLKKLDGPVARFHREQLGGMGEARLRLLSELLEEARTVGPEE